MDLLKNSCLSKQDSLGLCYGKSSIPNAEQKVGLRDGGEESTEHQKYEHSVEVGKLFLFAFKHLDFLIGC